MLFDIEWKISWWFVLCKVLYCNVIKKKLKRNILILLFLVNKILVVVKIGRKLKYIWLYKIRRYDKYRKNFWCFGGFFFYYVDI